MRSVSLTSHNPGGAAAPREGPAAAAAAEPNPDPGRPSLTPPAHAVGAAGDACNPNTSTTQNLGFFLLFSLRNRVHGALSTGVPLLYRTSLAHLFWKMHDAQCMKQTRELGEIPRNPALKSAAPVLLR